MKLLTSDFYLREATTVAEDLIGKIIVRTVGNQSYYYKIVETEAYMGEQDKGAHTFGGKKTNRTAPLFEKGGITYIYLIYGMYNCLNVVVNEEGVPQGVLIRALEPLNPESISFARENRKMNSQRVTDLTNGPGKLCRALAIDKTLNATSLMDKGALWIADSQEKYKIERATRINIPYAEEYQEVLWRFYIKDNPFVSVVKKP